MKLFWFATIKVVVFHYILCLFNYNFFEVYSKTLPLNYQRIDALKEAKRHKEYKVVVLENLKRNKTIIILGELHLKTPDAYELGSKIVNLFPLRALEGIPKNEFERLSSFERRIVRDNRLKKLENKNLKPSTIIYAKSLTTPPFHLPSHLTVHDFYNLKRLPHGLNVLLEEGEIKTFVSIYNPFYTFTHRNRRMHMNILTVMNLLKSNEPMLVIVGKAHLKSLKKRLLKNGYLPNQDILL